MKYLRKFENADALSAWRRGDEFVTPNVVLVNGEIRYNVEAVPVGVRIQHVDGTLYTIEDWTTNAFTESNANGVFVSNGEHAFIVATKDNNGASKWSTESVLVDGVFTTTVVDDARTDFDGDKNTTAILAALTGSSAANNCNLYTFPNGAKGYLPAAGELYMMRLYLSQINEALTLIGGIKISTTQYYFYWSSTQYDAAQAWQVSFYNNAVQKATKDYNGQYKYYIRPVTSVIL